MNKQFEHLYLRYKQFSPSTARELVRLALTNN